MQGAAFEMSAKPAEQRHHVLADQRLAAGHAQLPDAATDEGTAQPFQLLERKDLRLGQKRHVLGHAIDAAKVATIRHRDAKVGNRPLERIDETSDNASVLVAVRVTVTDIDGVNKPSQAYRLRVVVHEDDNGRMTGYDLKYPDGGN